MTRKTDTAVAEPVQPQREDLISLTKAATRLDCSRQTVLKKVAIGELRSEMVDERVFISRADVERAAGLVK